MSPELGFGLAGGLFGLMFVLVPLLMVAIIALGIYFGIKAYKDGKRRQAAIAATVAVHHLGHLAEDRARTTYFTGSPFGMGSDARARDIVWGTLGGRPFETFAYSYETESAEVNGVSKTTTHHFQITWVPLAAAVPTMRFIGDNALFRAATKLGARDLKVESHEFNQLWKVACDNERIGHAILTPRMIERFLQPDLRGRTFTFEGSALWSASPQVSDLGDLQLVVGALHSIVDLVPAFVFEDESRREAERRGEAVQ